MPDDHSPRAHGLATRLSHAGRAGTKVRGFVNPPVHRGSTMLHLDIADRIEGGKHRLEQSQSYGTQGNATHHALENVVAEIEGGTRCQIVSTGLAAVTVPLLCYLKSGEHCLMPDSVYGPARAFATGLLTHYGVTTEFYDPTITPGALEALFRPNTTVLYLESPGSHTFEVQDVPGLAAVAHAKGAKVLLDNTWGIHFFQPFQHGVDVSIQALTKYVVGHSDVLLGSITVAAPEEWERVRLGSLQLGQYASPDVHQVLHPALPGAPGHELWKRDFTGACSLFGVVFQPGLTPEAMYRMVDNLQLFGIGASWGGYESLALPTTGFLTRSAGTGEFAGPVCRFHIGLEEPADLIADLEQAFSALRGTQPIQT